MHCVAIHEFWGRKCAVQVVNYCCTMSCAYQAAQKYEARQMCCIALLSHSQKHQTKQ